MLAHPTLSTGKTWGCLAGGDLKVSRRIQDVLQGPGCAVNVLWCWVLALGCWPPPSGWRWTPDPNSSPCPLTPPITASLLRGAEADSLTSPETTPEPSVPLQSNRRRKANKSRSEMALTKVGREGPTVDAN